MTPCAAERAPSRSGLVAVGLRAQELLDLGHEVAGGRPPGARRSGRRPPSRRGGPRARPRPAAGTPGCARRARADRDRGCTSRRAGRAARGSRAATASPTTYCGTCAHRPAPGIPASPSARSTTVCSPVGPGVVGPERHQLLRERTLGRGRGARPRPCGATPARECRRASTAWRTPEPARGVDDRSTRPSATAATAPDRGPARRRGRRPRDHPRSDRTRT